MVGLTLIGRHSMDLRLLSIARAVERALEAASIET
jgi:Asp-tRNA(Asn)/Glu-tRNA(Gln) amidotransferase A subunit family amidase